jgi:hypothetical protein
VPAISRVPGECPAGSNVDTRVICPPTAFGQARASDPVRQGPHCCYTLYSQGCVGRPFVADGEVRRSGVVRNGDWCAPLPVPALGLPSALRSRLAEAWLDDALLEHASVAAFARFTLELVALGAPADLVRDATAAALDEVEHAKLCFSLAGRYADEPLGPTALDVSCSLAKISLSELAVATFHEGCVGETLAALVASEQLAGARDAHVGAALAKIADDEARHAELAWRTVKWALAEGGSQVRAAIENALAARLRDERGNANDCSGTESDEWRSHGRLSRAELESVRLRGLREVVVPCARALLSAAPCHHGELRNALDAS